MDMVYCGACGAHYNRSVTRHNCEPGDLALAFRQEQIDPEHYNLNSDDLRRIHAEIIANGSPAPLVKAWEKSAGRSFDARR